PDGDRLFLVPRYAGPDDDEGQRIADIAFRLKPGELSERFKVHGDAYALQCVGIVPAESGKDFAKEKAALLKDAGKKKIGYEIPSLFQELRKEGKPELLLKKCPLWPEPPRRDPFPTRRPSVPSYSVENSLPCSAERRPPCVPSSS